MRKLNKGEGGVELLIVLVLLIIILPVMWAISAYQCSAAWADSGLPSKWGIMSKCQISLDGGKTFIPENRYRAIEE